MSTIMLKILGGFIVAWLLGLGLGYVFKVIKVIYNALFNHYESE